MTTNQTIDGVPREFVREGRYIVVKPDYEDDIRTERLRNYIEEMCFHTPDCVVVEADFPECEPVWRMIEARVIGNPTELDAAKATISQLQGLVAELRALLDSTACEFHQSADECETYSGKHPCSPAAQGEPVAVFEIDHTGYRCKVVLDPSKPFPPKGAKLYAEQPAPDRPPHANPPTGTEPSGTHHDNDGLDEWRKPACCGSCPAGCVIQKESK